MPRLPSLDPLKVIKILESKGFVLERTKGSHKIFYNPETKRRAVVPIHRKDLPRGTLMEILRQAGFSREELDEALGR
ncbi:MAG: type II toxin-antitoxin system HicA family toxin [Candidatus Thermoplasmatota archaeon]|nr:addiction module toxin, HicA family [Euryarchaeota archaeon]MBU4071359.1 type II toxin-antitoxin system HicA family toxin [Candidatus Thermoplasmatota archaeon]MBU4144643.1 type II toxin-antitoxin system HicA family toxin [Candidatus Thermoplasmatota archaeon]MBU4592473.1 type II toxin-antitoxin system HicA family toxin [Candidatus Thermoplasmatota archaeon]